LRPFGVRDHEGKAQVEDLLGEDDASRNRLRFQAGEPLRLHGLGNKRR